MKNLKRFIFAVLAVLVVSAPASAQIFRFGVRAGVNVNSLSYSNAKDDLLSTDNRSGFVAGLTSEINVPIIGIGFDLSLLYTHRGSTIDTKNLKDVDTKADYLVLPINFKYSLSLPGLSQFVVPYIYTGPDLAFRLSKKTLEDMKNKTMDLGWDLGLGVKLLNHLKLSAGYTWGINKVSKLVIPSNIASDVQTIDIRNNCWTVTAAYLF